MKVLSIRQPWAALIIAGHKDIENRTWETRLRGTFAVHASQKIDPIGVEFAREHGIEIPPLVCGAVIGTVDLVDCVTHSESPWFFGPVGFVLRNPQPCRPIPLNGRLGFFEADLVIVPQARIEPPEPLLEF